MCRLRPRKIRGCVSSVPAGHRKGKGHEDDSSRGRRRDDNTLRGTGVRRQVQACKVSVNLLMSNTGNGIGIARSLETTSSPIRNDSGREIESIDA